jgi:hypothetical protein
MPGAMPEIFSFTVRDDAIAEQINQSMGSRVALHYRQHKAIPMRCFGESEYFVDRVVARDAPAVPGTPLPPNGTPAATPGVPSSGAAAPATPPPATPRP